LRALAGSTGDDLLRVVLREPPRAGLGEEVRELWPDTVVKIVVEGAPRPLEPGPEVAPGAVAPRDLFERYLAQRGITDERMTALFDRLYEEMHEAAAT
jgi:hypothetical protein